MQANDCKNNPSASTEVPSRVLSIQSHVVSGYVGNKCAVLPLQVLGFEVDFVNSVQFSNHTGYGKWKGQVLADTDLEDLYNGLEQNGLVNYSHLLTGYVGSETFLRQITSVVAKVKAKNPHCVYLCDPVLGDNGHFYVPESLIPIYTKEVLPLADITTPNTFELEYRTYIKLLSGMKVKTEEDALQAMDKLHDLGVKIVVLSSLDSVGPNLAVYTSLRSKCKRSVWKVVTSRFEGSFTGTGDLFAALFLGWYCKLGSLAIPTVLTTTLATMQAVLEKTKVAQPLVAGNRPRELRLVQSIADIMRPDVKLQAVEILPA